MRLLHTRLLLLGFAFAALVIGVLSYREPLRYTINIGDSYDVPFIAGGEAVQIASKAGFRWTNGDALVRIKGVSSSYPLTVSIHIPYDLRPDYLLNRPLTLTVVANGQPVFKQALSEDNQWYRFRVPPSANRQLDLALESETYVASNGLIRLGTELDVVAVEPATTPAPFADLDWQAVLLFALIVTLLGALGLRVGPRTGLALGLMGLVGGGGLLWLERPLFVFYAPVLAIALLLLLLLLTYLPPPRQRDKLMLFSATLALYLFFVSGQITSDDDIIKYLSTESLLTQHSLTFMTPQGTLATSRYGLGHTLAEAPFLSLALLAEGLRGQTLEQLRQFSVTLINPLSTALLIVLIYASACLLYANRRVALLLALVAALTTIIFPYALLTATEPLLALLLLAAIYCTLRYFRAGGEDNPGVWRARTGLCLAALALTKQEYIIFALLVIGWWLLREHRGQGKSWAAGLRQLPWLLGPLLLAAGEIITLNLSRNLDLVGSAGAPEVFTVPQISNLVAGIYGPLFSAGKSIFLFSPPLLLLPLAVLPFARARRWDFALWASLILAALLFYGRLTFWAGDLAFGDRYLIPFTPLLLLPLGMLIPRLGRTGRRVFAALCGLGLLVQALGVLVDFSSAFFIGVPPLKTMFLSYRLWEFDPLYSALTLHTNMLLTGRFKEQAVTQLSYYGLPGVADWLVPGLLLAVIIYAVVWLYHNGWSDAGVEAGGTRPNRATKSGPASLAGPPGAEGEI